MATPQDIRKRRLATDYQEMLNLRGDIISWEPVQGEPPHVEEYDMVVRVRTIISPEPTYKDEHQIKIILPAAYPQAPPQVEILGDNPYHPNWFTNNRWCYGTWDMSERLGHHIIRMIRTLQYDLEITNEHSPANKEANAWFIKNRHSGWFPCDTQFLPDPTRSKKFELTGKARFSLNSDD